MEQAKAEPAEERSEADQAFCSMILRQDNPARGLEDKWADLVSHMHSTETEQFRCGSCGSRYSVWLRFCSLPCMQRWKT